MKLFNAKVEKEGVLIIVEMEAKNRTHFKTKCKEYNFVLVGDIFNGKSKTYY